MDLGLNEKVIIITGGAGTIGKATAECFLSEGSTVVLADVNEDQGASVLTDLSSRYDGRVFFSPLDLRDESCVREFVKQVVDSHGGVDSIINNAMSFYFEELVKWDSFDILDEKYQIAIRGPLTLVQESWRLSERSRAGSVINVSSIAGHVGEPKAAAYTTFKAALKGMTLSFAIEMAPFGGWSVTVSPGHTWSSAHEKRVKAMGMSKEEYEESQPNIQSTMYGKFLDAKHVGEWIVLAASPIGKPLTGQDLRVSYGIEAGGFNRAYETEI